VWGLGTSGKGEDVGKGYRRVMWCKYCVYMYINGKMRPVETIPRIGRGSIKENEEGVNSTMMQCKNFYKCHNVPPAQQ
jgi:hypothetical protein